VTLFRKAANRILGLLRSIAGRVVLAANRLRYHLFFKSIPDDGEFCNSKRIRVYKKPANGRKHRPYLAIIRCGANHRLIDDRTERKFDIALNFYASPNDRDLLDGCEYSYSGGINKYKAAHQFLDKALLEKFRGFIFLDDDLEMTYSALNGFLEYCEANQFKLAQPSLTRDSFYSHGYLLQASRSGWRPVPMVEVMCPYFSSAALRVALNTFDLSYSTWGLDFIWPRLLALEPVVVDGFTIKHSRPVGGPETDSPFYVYMRGIGVSPGKEKYRLQNLPDEKVRALAPRKA